MIQFRALKTMAMALAAVALLGGPAAADSVTYNLDQDACTNSCGVSQALTGGTITLTEVTAFQVDVIVTLAQVVKFVNTGAGDALAFNMTPGLSIQLGSEYSSTTGPYSWASTSVFVTDSTPKGYQNGGYGYGVDYTAGSGASQAVGGALKVSVISTTAISIANFVANSIGILFSVDVIGTTPNYTGNTGNIGAKASSLVPGGGGGTTAVPEPMSMLLFGPAAFGLAALRRRRR
ncbi:MAG: PEP-CTERM sorting domain-containing protein [Alphaproteobacteria bacterium]|nr:PEP-CTERM sorting domain-containing protein [Alphaproteobacteria bacterium]